MRSGTDWSRSVGGLLVASATLLGACQGSRARPPAGAGAISPAPSAAASGGGGGTVFGTVTFREGNCMPGPEPSPGTTLPNPCRRGPIATGVYAYPLLEAEASADPTHPDVGEPTHRTTADANGRFDLPLPAGRWSILVDDGGRPYCNSTSPDDGRAVLCAVAVGAGERVQFDAVINHAVD